ncbi:hypothetical protein [Comamonas sp. MYb396]|uniref:LexA family protein n=1 Tax=Comamonas sp. MYb396 TaxID=2745302 RepID=UPI0030A0F199
MTTQNQNTDLTNRQREVLDYMRCFLLENDQLPPMHAIAEHFGHRSPNSAQNHLNALERKGFIERNAVGKYRFVRDRVLAANEEAK